jgi:hypothetical protein
MYVCLYSYRPLFYRFPFSSLEPLSFLTLQLSRSSFLPTQRSEDSNVNVNCVAGGNEGKHLSQNLLPESQIKYSSLV